MVGLSITRRFSPARALVFVSLSLSLVTLTGCGSSSGSIPVANTTTRTYTEYFPVSSSLTRSYNLVADIRPDSPVQITYTAPGSSPQVLQEDVDYVLNRSLHFFRLLRTLPQDTSGSTSLMVQYQPVL